MCLAQEAEHGIGSVSVEIRGSALMKARIAWQWHTLGKLKCDDLKRGHLTLIHCPKERDAAQRFWKFSFLMAKPAPKTNSCTKITQPQHLEMVSWMNLHI